MRREEFIKYTLDKRELVNKINVKDRELKIKNTKNFVISIIGPRRAGKTYFLYNLMKEFKPENSLYLNFEDLELEGVSPRDILIRELL